MIRVNSVSNAFLEQHKHFQYLTESFLHLYIVFGQKLLGKFLAEFTLSIILVINQPSRIIITNIHANPGIPIQNQPTGVPSLVPKPEKIENYAVLSIFSLICCCFPIGLLASLMSFQVYDDPCPHIILRSFLKKGSN